MSQFPPHLPSSVSSPLGGTSNLVGSPLKSKDFEELLEEMIAGDWLQQKLADKLGPEAHTIGSVEDFMLKFPPERFAMLLGQIREVLLELGLPQSAALDELSEYLFAEIYIGQPQIAPV